MQVGVADLIGLQLGRRRHNHEIIVLIAARLDLVGRAQQIDIDLETAAQVAAGGVAQVRARFQQRPRHRRVILLDRLVVIRLRPAPHLFHVRLSGEFLQHELEAAERGRIGRNLRWRHAITEVWRALHDERVRNVLVQLRIPVPLPMLREGRAGEFSE